ncbi:hypothetical protein [Algoriphagus sp. Y33]|uniref:hypothetical protein n=1 Tax=Algoriphagus sp. Y33 TaxID=2772483 RepID=UPI001786A43F|nr:hypothetical protein [Algoriphagus sp. Y33]
MPIDPSSLKKCLALIEENLGWGDSQHWKNSDFELLSEKIFSKTGVNLSTSTLRRLWGKVKYESEPQITTLNALAKFVGFDSFRAFNDSIHEEDEIEIPEPGKPEDAPLHKKGMLKWLSKQISALLVVAALITVILVGWDFLDKKPEQAVDPATFTFSSQPVTSGVPNSVVFEFDVSSASTDSLFIQQSWDTSKRFKIDKNQDQATSVYYYPGYFRAKLIMGEEVMQEHDLLIATDGWLSLVEKDPVPIYFKKEVVIKNGKLALSESDLLSKNVSLQPELPISRFYYVEDFGGLSSDSFSLETRFRNTYSEGSGTCQFSQLVIICQNSALMIPVSIPGCSSEIGVFLAGESIEGKKADLSGFGVDSSEWAEMQVSVINKEVKVHMADKLVLQKSFSEDAGDIVGVAYFFEGIGEIDFLRLFDKNQKVILKEEF